MWKDVQHYTFSSQYKFYLFHFARSTVMYIRVQGDAPKSLVDHLVPREHIKGLPAPFREGFEDWPITLLHSALQSFLMQSAEWEEPGS